jgi:hypothetical protein
MTLTKKSGPQRTGKEPAPTKRVAPRDRQDVTPLTPAQLEAAREKRIAEAALYKNPDPSAGFDLCITVLSATIDKGEIRIMAKVEGQVVRPEAYAVARGITQEIVVPATIVSDEGETD